MREDSLVIARWPEADAKRIDGDAEQTIAALIEFISAARTLRAEYNVPPADDLDVLVGSASAPLAGALAREKAAIRRLARVEARDVSAKPLEVHGRAGAHAVLRSGADVFIPLEGIIDLARERARLGEERARIDGQVATIEKLLANSKFVEKAKPEIVERERMKLDSFRDQSQRLDQKLRALGVEA